MVIIKIIYHTTLNYNRRREMLRKAIKKTAPFILSLCLVCSTVNAAEPDGGLVNSWVGVNEELSLDDLFEVEIL